jgi:hypothetical protein
MEASIPAADKKSGVYYAVTTDGIELPVIDITHQAFALRVTDAKIQELLRRYVTLETLSDEFKRSILGRSILGTPGNFLAGMSTYL